MRVGGMAFGNGVLMRGPHFWALARADGTMLDGRIRTLLTRHRWLRLPIVRSLVSLAEMMGLAIFLHSRNGVRRGVILLAWLGLYIAFDFALGVVFALMIPNILLGNVLLGLCGIAFGLLALRQGLGKTIWGYHGAEHKAVNAYEHGADLSDLEAVAGHNRVHDRCGTNLMVIAFLLLMLGYWPIGGLAGGELLGGVYGVLVVAVAFEFFRLVSRRPDSRLSRVALAGGRALQRHVTTREPDFQQLHSACTALTRVIELERGA